MSNKKGVSLITVLLFMLVATIAGTATFKWLTSEGRSSASRMEMQEARQSAIAGIQSTRAWMTNNANDVGAAIRQYLLGGNQPISLNSRVTAHMNGKQDFNVWLTGVSEVNGFFKLKILSEGTARHNAKHTEAAIINVSGLYQVNPPVEEVKSKNIAFDYSYFGGSIANHGSALLSSMLINGNWYGNPIGLDRNIIITGNAKLSGDNVNIYGTGCIGGDLFADNGIDAGSIYVAGTTKQFGTKNSIGVRNHAYFDGDLEQDMNRPVRIGQNMTATKNVRTSMGNGSSSFTVEGNLCLEAGAQVQIGDMQGQYPSLGTKFTVNGDVKAVEPNSFYARAPDRGDFHNYYETIVLGSKTTSTVYLPDAYKATSYNIMRKSKTFKENQDFRKNCSNPIKDDTGNKENACFNRDSDDQNRASHQWDYWHDDEYSPYVYIDIKNDMYYLYNADFSANDVQFKEYTNTNWKNKTRGQWENSTPIGAYFVGGKVFYETYKNDYNNLIENWNYLNYGDGYPKKLSPYCNAGTDKFRPECHVTPWFQSKGTVTRDPPPTTVTCADSVRKFCYDIWEEKPGCDGARFKVDDILKTAYDTFYPYRKKGCAATITVLDDDMPAKMNACYRQLYNDDNKRRDSLYNDYLVVEVESRELKQNFSENLNGKFIIILKNETNHTVVFPPTANSNSFVFLYMPENAYQLQGVNKEASYNYFVYLKKNIGTSTYGSDHSIQPNGGLLFNTDYFKGSVYAEAANCAKTSALTSSKPMTFNKELLNSLTESRVICEISVPVCGGVAQSSSSAAEPTSSSSNVSENSIFGKDPYFISIAPQLHVTLESQYKTTEAVPEDASDLEESVIILPRIIYLPNDPKGSLADYYSAFYLNGAKKANDGSASVECNGAFPTTGDLYDGVKKLSGGTFTCKYKSNYGNVPFYVVISGASGSVPEVKFDETQQPLNLGESITASVLIDPSEQTGGKIKFDFSISDEYAGWTVIPAPGVTERLGGGHKRYFTVEVTPNASETQRVNLLTVETEESAVDGDLYIALSTPTELCMIGKTNVQHIYVMGHTPVSRETLSDYCAKYSDCTESELEKKDYPDCYYEGEWIRATGTNCSEVVKNDKWSCLTTSPISLEAVNTDDIPANCEVIFPHDHNTVEEPKSGDLATLYASLKKKMVELTIQIKDAKDPATYVRVYDEQTLKENICTKENAPCTFKVIAGAPIVISHEDYNKDRESFSYWTCAGANCPSGLIRNDENEFKFFNSHTVVAEYSKESHCYYDDFSNTTAFCAAYAENCIDTCSVELGESKACSPRNAKQSKSHWLMLYHNDGAKKYTPPKFGSGSASDSRSIFAPTPTNTNKQYHNVSLILRNKNAGQYGIMNSLIQTSVLGDENPNDFLNSGLVFRSSGKEHLILNIYGVSTTGQSSGNLTFRVCKVDGQAISSQSEGNCQIVPKNDGISDVSISSNDFIKVAFTINSNDQLSINASVNDQIWKGEVSVKDYGLNENIYTYVGFSLADQGFKLYDNGWQSLSFNDVCWEIPSVSCSFADNFVGETVPFDEDVTPKVLMSSWFSEKNCTTEYHYNGCDNTTSQAIDCGSGEIGQPGEMGAVLSGNMYHFSQEGAHGYLIDNYTKAKDASVKVVCPGDQTSLDLAQDYYSCGAFWVGDVYNCTSEIKVFDDAQYISENETIEYTINNTNRYINMRGSVLHVDLQNGIAGPGEALNANITVQLQSTNGMKSLPRTISKTGVTELSIDAIANTIGFDPQQVSKVFITSDENINLTKLRIENKCPYKFEFDCSKITATYQMGGGLAVGHQALTGWKIDLKLGPGAGPKSQNATCKFEADDNNITPFENKCENTVLTYQQGTYFNWMSGELPTFTITYTNGDNTSVCSVKGEWTSVNSDLTCSIPEDQQDIPLGSAAPPFTFKLGQEMVGPAGNKLKFTINYKVTLGSEIVGEGTTDLGKEVVISPNKTLEESGDYTYKVEAWLGNTLISAWTPTCTREFKVSGSEEVPTVNCAESSVNSEGTFIAKINTSGNVSYNYTVAVTNPLGNVLSGETNSSMENTISYTYTPGRAGNYNYVITIGESSCTKPFEVTSPLAVTCLTPSITNQAQDEIINVSASVDNCEEPCTQRIINSEGLQKNENNEHWFYDLGSTGTKKYTFQVTDGYGNTRACDFDVTFKSNTNNQNADYVLRYGQEQFLNTGTHKVKCTHKNDKGEPNENLYGRLICRCPIAQWDYYNCMVEVDGKKTEIYSERGYQTVDGENNKCQRDNTVTITIYPPNKYNIDNSGKTHEQESGVYCQHNW